MGYREGALLIAMVKDGWLLPVSGVLLWERDLEGPGAIGVQRREPRQFQLH